MANGIYQKRVIFKKGEQKRFLFIQIERLNVSWTDLSNKIGIHNRTLNDWKREKYSIPIDKLEKICKLSNSERPKNIKIKPAFWHIGISSKLGAAASIKKYGRIGGDQAYQKKRWYEWWYEKGQHNPVGCIRGPLPIKIPKFSADLAEFAGIVIGDGGITNKQVIITTNSVDDRKYGYFIKKLIRKLFDVDASIYYVDGVRVMKIAVSRKKLVEFCNKKLKLKIGNKLKQGLDIPDWIKKDLEFEKACVRGIMDTDGCIFNECHKIKNKLYNYKRLNITSASPALIKSIFDIFYKLGLNPKIRKGRCVQIEDKDDIKRYFEIIETHNPKHLKRYYK